MNWSILKVGDRLVQDIAVGVKREVEVIKATPTFVWISPTDRKKWYHQDKYWIKIRRESGRAVGTSQGGRMSMWTTGASYTMKEKAS
jgi:hypothetical protein